MAFPLYAPSVFLPRRRHEYICFITVIKINALRKKKLKNIVNLFLVSMFLH